MAQLVKHPTLDFGSGHDLVVQEFELHIGLHADSAEPAWDILALLSLKINRLKKKNKELPSFQTLIKSNKIITLFFSSS